MGDDEETLEELFEKLAREREPLDFLSQFICPTLIGDIWEYIRKATLLLLATQNDTNTTRIRLHTLLVGSPGTGKTVFLSWVQENLGGILISSEHTSKTGLVGDARGHRITPGLLADYDGNIVLPDELDKMSGLDQSGLLQAMEEGKYMIVKGKQRMEFDAEVRVIAGANQLDKIVKPLQDRFDFIFKLSVVKREKRAENVDKLIKAFFGTNEMEKSQLILEYLRWVKDFKPVIEEQDFEAISEMMAMYIRKTSTKIDNVSIRNLEMSILRIAYAMAKLEKSNIKPKHVKRAILFKNAVLKKLVGEREQ